MLPVLGTQKGMVLLVSLVFLMLLGFLGLSAMESAAQQEKWQEQYGSPISHFRGLKRRCIEGNRGCMGNGQA